MDGETDGPQATAKSGGGRRLSFPSYNIPLQTRNSLFMAFAALSLLNEWQGIAPMSGVI